MSKVSCNINSSNSGSISNNRMYLSSTITSQHHNNRQQQQKHHAHYPHHNSRHHLLHHHHHHHHHSNHQKFHKNNNAAAVAHSNSIFNQVPSANSSVIVAAKASTGMVGTSEISTSSPSVVCSSVSSLFGHNRRKTLPQRNCDHITRHRYSNNIAQSQRRHHDRDNDTHNGTDDENRLNNHLDIVQQLPKYNDVAEIVDDDDNGDNDNVEELLTTGTCVTSTTTITCKSFLLSCRSILRSHLFFYFFF